MLLKDETGIPRCPSPVVRVTPQTVIDIQNNRKQKQLFMQKGAVVTFPTFALLPEFARKMGDAIERLLFSVCTALHSFAFTVPILSILLVIVIHWTFAVIVHLIRCAIAVVLHWRTGLRLLELGKDGAKIHVGCWLRWRIVYRVALPLLINCCHGSVDIKA